MTNTKKPTKQPFKFGFWGFWITILSIISAFILPFISDVLILLAMVGTLVGMIFSIIGLFKKPRGYAIAVTAIHAILILMIILLTTIFIPMIVPHG